MVFPPASIAFTSRFRIYNVKTGLPGEVFEILYQLSQMAFLQVGLS